MLDQHPFDRVADALRHRGLLTGRSCRILLDRLRARCPAHADNRASLSASRKEDRILLQCFAGCRTADVVAALGFRMADLFSACRTPMQRPSVEAEYDYRDPRGGLIAQKVRFSNKTFKWRQPGHDDGSWTWNLHGVTPGLYRLPDLVGAFQVFVNEGEKSVDLLRSLGAHATCPPSGASSWLSSWSLNLWQLGCREMVILADNDRAGDQHAERVAEITAQVVHECDEPMIAKIVRLPGLEKGADAFDWLKGGHTLIDLLNVAAEAPLWSPGMAERERADRRRALARVRQQRFRANRRMVVIGNAVNDQRNRVA